MALPKRCQLFARGHSTLPAASPAAGTPDFLVAETGPVRVLLIESRNLEEVRHGGAT